MKEIVKKQKNNIPVFMAFIFIDHKFKDLFHIELKILTFP